MCVPNNCYTNTSQKQPGRGCECLKNWLSLHTGIYEKDFLPAFKSWISSVSKGKAEPGQCCVVVFYGMWVFFFGAVWTTSASPDWALTWPGPPDCPSPSEDLPGSQSKFITRKILAVCPFKNFICLLASMKTCFQRDWCNLWNWKSNWLYGKSWKRGNVCMSKSIEGSLNR